jgi:hypothetical protein
MLKYGLLISTFLLFTHYFVCRSLITWDLNTWYYWGTILHLIMLAAIVVYGCIGATGGFDRTRLKPEGL